MAVPTESTFAEFIRLSAEHEVPLAGSVGRAVLIGETYLSPLRPNGSIRDIDIVNVAQHAEAAASLPEELEYDKVWLHRFVEEDCLVYPGRKNEQRTHEPIVCVPVPHLEEALESGPVQNLNGQECLVLRPDTQLALDVMFGSVLQKRQQSVHKLDALVTSMDTQDRLDPEILEPFAVFAEQVSNLWRRKLYLGARVLYHSCLPRQAVQSAHPLIKKVARGRLV
jgi:hypothetical protein